MANSYIEYNQNLSETTYSVPFNVLSIDDVNVKGYDGTTWSDLTVSERDAVAKTVKLDTAPSAYQKIRVWRNTGTTQLVDFQNGSRLSESDLDTAYQQGLFVAQEVSEGASTAPSFKGDQGIQGIQGIQGPTGPTGPLGPTGPQGADSTVTGPAGADGTNGTNASPFPAGSVIYHAANTAPSGFLKADGATVSRSTYSDLFAAIGTTYGAGDGSTTFLVPDLRGEFMRGWDDSRGVDGSRSFGSAQSDQMEAHNHTGGTPMHSSHTATYGSVSAGGSGPGGSFSGGRYAANTSTVGGTGNSSETRPRNVALLACIKF
jgi:microcystin-dependent protein